jgi:hypothetical protein
MGSSFHEITYISMAFEMSISNLLMGINATSSREDLVVVYIAQTEDRIYTMVIYIYIYIYIYQSSEETP